MKEESGNKIKELEERLEELEWDKKPHLDRCKAIQQAFNDGAIRRVMPWEKGGYCLSQGGSQYSQIFMITHCPFCGEKLEVE